MTTPNQAAPAAAPRAQTAGRGLLLITVAKLWFMVGGGALGLLLPRMFPRDASAARYGEWQTVLAWMSLLNNVLITGTIQAVSRFAARGPSWVEGTKRLALRTNLVVVAVIGVTYFTLTPLIAGAMRDASITSALRLSTGVVVCYGFYAVFVGAANGAREFHKQAGLDIAFTTLRAALVLGAAGLFGTVLGAMAGFVTAAAAILVASVFVVGWRPSRAADQPRVGELLSFAAPVAAYLLVLNLLMFVDVWLLKRYVALAAEQGGAAATAAAEVASRAVGAYGAALQIARLPYQATIAVTFVIFPLVSQSTFENDLARTREYIKKAVRLSLLVVVSAAAAVAARPDSILLLLFRKTSTGVNEFAASADAMALLMFGYAAFSLFSIAGTIINGSGGARVALVIGAFTFLLDAGLNVAAITIALDRGLDPLRAAAAATMVAMSVGFASSLLYLRYRFGAALSLLTLGRVALATAIAIGVGRALPLPGRAGLAAVVIAGLVYAVVLAVTREVTAAEVRSLLRRR